MVQKLGPGTKIRRQRPFCSASVELSQLDTPDGAAGPTGEAYDEAVTGLAETVNMDHITRGYYSIKALNPNRIRPTGPAHIVALIASV